MFDNQFSPLNFQWRNVILYFILNFLWIGRISDFLLLSCSTDIWAILLALHLNLKSTVRTLIEVLTDCFENLGQTWCISSFSDSIFSDLISFSSFFSCSTFARSSFIFLICDSVSTRFWFAENNVYSCKQQQAVSSSEMLPFLMNKIWSSASLCFIVSLSNIDILMLGSNIPTIWTI